LIAAQTADGDWVPEAGGVDLVATVDGQTVVASSTDYTDHGGGYGAGRLGRLFALAKDHRWPIVFFVDGGGSRARHPRVGLGHLELSSAIGPFNLFDGMAELSGWVPTIAIVSGPAFAGHASLAGFSDVVIATGGSSIGMGGPPMVEAALGKRLTATELAGVEMHELTGGIDLLVGDEIDAIAAAKAYLSFWRDHDGGEPAAGWRDIAALVPEDGPYDVWPVIDALVDAGSTLELRPAFARAVVTAFARMGGRSVGVLASQPQVDGGAIDDDAATKVARFVELCDAYDFPIVSLIDTPGCVGRRPRGDGRDGTERAHRTDGTDGEGGRRPALEAGFTRWHGRAVMAHHHRTVPLFSVRLRHGAGAGPLVMAGTANGRTVPTLALAWPTAVLGRPDGFSVFHDRHALDDVVLPVETRERIVRMLAHRPRPTDRREKKHPVDTW
jgi:acetyl-CoA carboxylase carboxyltransferase component